MTKPRKTFLVMVSALLMTVALTGAGLYFADSYLANQAKSISDLRADDEVLSIDLINSQKMRDDLKRYSYIDTIADEILPNAKNQSKAILLINEMGQEVGVNIDTFTFIATRDDPGDKTQTEPLEGAPDILVFPVTVKFSGTYSQLINWLRLAEKNQRKMQVAKIDIIPKTDAEGNIVSSNFSVSIIVNAYVEK